MSRSDAASLAGTWVGAGIGLIALLTLLGPFLLWRASRTVRHRALVAVGRRNHGYISQGIPFWPGLRFFQSLRTPNTKHPRRFDDAEWQSFDLSRLSSTPDSPASWVQFGACLEAYGLKMTPTEDADLANGTLFLRVHRSYLFSFLVLGRYQKRNTARLSMDPRLTKSKSIVLAIAHRSADMVEDEWLTLHGLTGTLRFGITGGRHRHLSLSGDVKFSTDILAGSTRDLVVDSLPRISILLLMLGFLPLPSGHHVCCNVGKHQEPDTINDSDGDISEDDSRMVDVYTRYGNDSDSDSESELERRTDDRRERSRSYRTPVHEIEKSTAKALKRLRLSVYELREMPIMPESTRQFGFEYTSCTASTLCMMEDVNSPDLLLEVQELASLTYIPPSAVYVRVRSATNIEDSGKKLA